MRTPEEILKEYVYFDDVNASETINILPLTIVDAMCEYAEEQRNKWVNINNDMPDRHKYVLIQTPYCKYKCSVGFWNGVEWKSADDNATIANVEFWQELPIIED